MLTVPSLIVLNLTTDCNMRCKYCYASAGDKCNYMQAKTSINLITQLHKLKKGQKIKILFHGGGPLFCFSQIKEITEF